MFKLISLGKKYDDFNAVCGWRAEIGKIFGKITATILLFCVGTTVQYEEIDYDYSYYLGKEYKKT